MSEKAGYRIIRDKSLVHATDVNEYSSGTMEVIDNEVKRLLNVSFSLNISLLHKAELFLLK